MAKGAGIDTANGIAGDAVGAIDAVDAVEILAYSDDIFEQAFSRYDAIIAIMACGIVVRKIGALVSDKWSDPAVVVVDSNLNFAISLLGGHHGANTLVKRLAGLGCVPVITTATESHGRPSVEGIADALSCEVLNRASTKNVNMVLLDADVPVVKLRGPKIVVVDENVSVIAHTRKASHYSNNSSDSSDSNDSSDSEDSSLVVGIGARKGVSTQEVWDAVMSGLLEVGASIGDVGVFATSVLKEHEKGIIECARLLNQRLEFLSDDVLNATSPLSESEAQRFGLLGVAEPCALALSCRGELILKKKVYGNVTIAIAR